MPPRSTRPETSLRRASPARRSAAVLAALGLLLSACTQSDADGQSGSPTPPGQSPATASATDQAAVTPTQPEVVAENLQAPWSIAFAGDVPLISERDSGRILALSADETTEPAATREVGTVPGVVPGGEGGLLGIAVSEEMLYAYFTSATDNRIVRFPLTGTADTLGLGEPETVIDGIPKASTHNGGRLAFGPDGLLYATAGDAGDGDSAQDRETLSGKILRMTPNGDVPADNPFPDSYVYSYGHRNPQGIAWDEAGTMYASEFGQNTWDELNVIEAGGNYGWPTVEGIAPEAETGRFVDPVQQWSPAEASPSGIAVADGTILIANLRGQVLREVPVDDLSQAQTRYAGEFGRLRDVVATPEGQLWMLTNNTDGRGSPVSGDDRIIRIPPPG